MGGKAPHTITVPFASVLYIHGHKSQISQIFLPPSALCCGLWADPFPPPCHLSDRVPQVFYTSHNGTWEGREGPGGLCLRPGGLNGRLPADVLSTGPVPGPTAHTTSWSCSVPLEGRDLPQRGLSLPEGTKPSGEGSVFSCQYSCPSQAARPWVSSSAPPSVVLCRGGGAGGGVQMRSLHSSVALW